MDCLIVLHYKNDYVLSFNGPDKGKLFFKDISFPHLVCSDCIKGAYIFLNRDNALSVQAEIMRLFQLDFQIEKVGN